MGSFENFSVPSDAFSGHSASPKQGPKASENTSSLDDIALQRIKALPMFREWENHQKNIIEKRIEQRERIFRSRQWHFEMYTFALILHCVAIYWVYGLMQKNEIRHLEQTTQINAPYIFSLRQSLPLNYQSDIVILNMGPCNDETIQKIKEDLSPRYLTFSEHDMSKDHQMSEFLYRNLLGTGHESKIAGPVFIVKNKIILYSKDTLKHIESVLNR